LCHETAKALQTNSHEAPMSSEKARQIIDTALPNGGLRMNLGNGRNGVYVAPCERRLECPLEKQGEYLVHTHQPKIITDLSKVEFGIRVDGWRRVVFKTVSDSALAQRELAFYHKVAETESAHVMQLLDEFTDNSAKHVMVFPRMNSLSIQGHDLFDIAYLARQLLIALEDLHRLGIAHLDITPTNLMADPKDGSHIELIDFGLACDLSATESGQLPSRGTCGFVAPEVLSGTAHDLRADIYSAGVVLGMMLQNYLPTVDLRLLGGPLIRSDTTDMIISQIDELLDAYEYTPEQAEFIECQTTFVPKPMPEHRRSSIPSDMKPLAKKAAHDSSQPSVEHVSRPASPPPPPPPAQYPSSPSAPYGARHARTYSDEDDEAAAFAAAFVGGGSSMYSNYCDMDDTDMLPDTSRFTGQSFYSRNSYSTSQLGRYVSNSRTGNELQYAHSIAGCDIDSGIEASYPNSTGYCVSPSTTPVYSASRDPAMHGTTRGNSLPEILESASASHSSSRYAHSKSKKLPFTVSAIRPSASTQSNGSAGSSAARKPGRVPLGVLHAADLLRWTLQAKPQCRPTATQALEHPFLASVVIKPRRRNTSTAVTSYESPSLVARPDAECVAMPTCRPLDATKPHSRAMAMSQDDGLCMACTCHSSTPLLHGGENMEGSAMESARMMMVCAEPSACSTKVASPSASKSPSPDSSVSSSVRDEGIFKNSGVCEIHVWEREMYSRLSRASHRGYDRMGDDRHHYGGGYASSNNACDDEVSHFYSAKTGYDDDDEDHLTSYYY
ncbi:hypothetical protein FBU59_001981, partial [Linderina macrospora]